MALAVLFMLVMLHTMHTALKEMKAAGELQQSENGSDAHTLDAPCASIV